MRRLSPTRWTLKDFQVIHFRPRVNWYKVRLLYDKFWIILENVFLTCFLLLASSESFTNALRQSQIFIIFQSTSFRLALDLPWPCLGVLYVGSYTWVNHNRNIKLNQAWHIWSRSFCPLSIYLNLLELYAFVDIVALISATNPLMVISLSLYAQLSLPN